MSMSFFHEKYLFYHKKRDFRNNLVAHVFFAVLMFKNVPHLLTALWNNENRNKKEEEEKKREGKRGKEKKKETKKRGEGKF